MGCFAAGEDPIDHLVGSRKHRCNQLVGGREYIICGVSHIMDLIPYIGQSDQIISDGNNLIQPICGIMNIKQVIRLRNCFTGDDMNHIRLMKHLKRIVSNRYTI